MVKGHTLGKDSANELMGDFTAALLVRALWIAVENPAPYFSEFGTLNGYGVSKFAASVCQDNWEQTAILFMSKNVIQPFKNLRDRPCSVSVSQECSMRFELRKNTVSSTLPPLRPSTESISTTGVSGLAAVYSRKSS